MSNRYWGNDPKYKRILEILDDYWITCEDELLVNIEMQFLNNRGEFQKKYITWKNPQSKAICNANSLETAPTECLARDSLACFMKDCIEITTNKSDRVLRKALYEEYFTYCVGENLTAVRKQSFFKKMRNAHIQEIKACDYFFCGIRLKNKKYEEKNNMEEIVWFNKERTGGQRKHEDISIRSVKSGMSIIVRNNLAEEISESLYIRIGFAKNDRNRMFFMAADKEHGWKMSISSTNPSTMTCQIRDDRLADGLKRFEGDYNLEISDDNMFFIDRRNVL